MERLKYVMTGVLAILLIGAAVPIIGASISYFDHGLATPGQRVVSTTKPLPVGKAKVVAPQDLSCVLTTSTQFPSIAAKNCCFSTVDTTNHFEFDLGAVTPGAGSPVSHFHGVVCVGVDTNCDELFCAGIVGAANIAVWGEGG